VLREASAVAPGSGNGKAEALEFSIDPVRGPVLALAPCGVDRAEALALMLAEAPSDASADAKPGLDRARPDQATDKKPAERDVYYNFSPALVLSGDRLMLCSTKQIADELADLAAKPTSAKAPQNTLLEIAAQPIGKLLQENREQLIAQNMLEKGHSRPEAEKEVDVFVALVNAVKNAKVSLTPTDKTIALDIELETSTTK